MRFKEFMETFFGTMVPAAAKIAVKKLFAKPQHMPFGQTWTGSYAIQKWFDLTEEEIKALYQTKVLRQVPKGVELDQPTAVHVSKMMPQPPAPNASAISRAV